MNSKRPNNSQQKVRTPIREVNKKRYANDDTNSQKKISKTPEYVEHSEENNQASPTSTQKLLSIGVVIVIFIAIIVGVYFVSTALSQDSNDSPTPSFDTNETISQTTNLLDFVSINESSSSKNSTPVVIIENKNCEFCQIETINKDLNQILGSIKGLTNYSYTRVNMSSNSSQRIISHINNGSLEYEFTPLYVFSSQVEEIRAISEELFNSLFIKVQNSTNYILDPQNIGVRYLNKQFDLPNSTIQIGNVNATPITIMNDYWCKRCQIINGDVSTITQAQEEGIISQNYSAPVSNLLLAIKSVESPQDLSFHINYIPSPSSQESEQLQLMNYCAHEQESFVELHVTLVDSIKNAREPIQFNNSQISQLSQVANLNTNQFIECLNSQEAKEFRDDMNTFLQEEQITSLPFMVVGNYPLLEVADEQILSLLLQSENQVFN